MSNQLVINFSAMICKGRMYLKRVLWGILICVSLSGCGNKEIQNIAESTDEVSADSANTISTDMTDTREYSLCYNGAEIKVNADSEEILSQIGTPESSFESPLCGIDGKDILLDYGHFDLDVFETKDRSYIYSVVFKDDLITTKEGVFIGETEQKVREIYGEEQEKRGDSLIYKADSMELIFIIHEGIVTSIQYISTVDGI